MSSTSDLLDNLELRVGRIRTALQVIWVVTTHENVDVPPALQDELELLSYAIGRTLDDMESLLGGLRANIEEAAK